MGEAQDELYSITLGELHADLSELRKVIFCFQFFSPCFPYCLDQLVVEAKQEHIVSNLESHLQRLEQQLSFSSFQRQERIIRALREELIQKEIRLEKAKAEVRQKRGIDHYPGFAFGTDVEELKNHVQKL